MSSFAELAAELETLVEGAAGQLAAIGDHEDVSIKPSPERWSKLEILGHLVDSASNNHQRFVRAALQGELTFPGYEQEGWARVQRHQDALWHHMHMLWSLFNMRLAQVIEVLPATAATIPCRIGDGDPVTLHWLVEDYIKHMRHHLKQLLTTTAEIPANYRFEPSRAPLPKGKRRL